MSGRVAAVRLPGFDESLRLLVEREEYSDLDIAMMFEVTRERVRQRRESRGLTRTGWRGMFHLRVWDEEQDRFIAVSRGAFHQADHDARARQKRCRRKAAQAERAAAIVAVCRAPWTPEHRPTWSEIAQAIGIGRTPRSSVALVVARWDSSSRPTGDKRRAFVQAIGFDPGAGRSGGKGHAAGCQCGNHRKARSA